MNWYNMPARTDAEKQSREAEAQRVLRDARDSYTSPSGLRFPFKDEKSRRCRFAWRFTICAARHSAVSFRPSGHRLFTDHP